MTDLDGNTPKLINGGEIDNKRLEIPADTVASINEADLISGYEDAKATFALVMRNKVTEAVDLCTRKAKESMFHSLAQTAIALGIAYLSFDKDAVETAMQSSSTCAKLCYQHRRKTSITDNTFTKANKRKFYDEFTEVEIQAELCYAQCQALRAFTTMIRDETVLTFLKGGFRFRLSYQAYKLCQEILAHRTKWNNEYLRKEFECGVAFGIGTYNVILSSFPKRFQKVFEFIGFSAKFDVGEGKLEEAYQFKGCLMQLVGCITILGYHLVFCSCATRGCGSITYAESVLNSCLTIYPKSAIFSAFAGRLENMKGNREHAIQYLERSLEEDLESMSNIKHIVLWEKSWCHILSQDYRAALPGLSKLCRESNWSKLLFHYTKAIALFSCEDITEEERQEVASLLREASKARMCFAGKTIPLEKEFCRKCELYFLQGCWMLLPIFELMYMFNYFTYLKQAKLEVMLDKVECELDNVKNRSDWKYSTENQLLATFMKGVCLSQLGRKAIAEECFKDVIKNQKKIKDATYLSSCSNMELGFIYRDANKPVVAKSYLKEAMKHKTFWAEFRIRRALEELKTGKSR